MSMRRLFIIRKDLNIPVGKLSAMIAHCSEAYWTNLIRRYTVKVPDNIFPCVEKTFKDLQSQQKERKVQLYKRSDLCNLSVTAFSNGKDYFLASKQDGEYREDTELKYHYESHINIANDIFEQYVDASFVKTICEAKNLNHLLKAENIATELNLLKGLDFDFINDNCLTELKPENEDGTCTVGIWFKPLEDEIAHQISKKYQLYK